MPKKKGENVMFIGTPVRILYEWKFVPCCRRLANALDASDLFQLVDEEDNHPFITFYEDEGYARDGELFFCPFCGKKIDLERKVFKDESVLS